MDSPVPQPDGIRPAPDVDLHDPVGFLDRLWNQRPGDVDRPASNWRTA